LDTLGSVSRAADCAVEIIRVCSNYRVETAGPTQLNRLLSTARLGLGNNRLTVQGPPNSLPRNPNQESAFATYLNVHCGLSVGMMAGIDIGADNRWEYFIVGDPLREVALAEEHAEKGQVAMSSVAHSILHPDDNQFCSCVKHESGLCWILSSSPMDRFSIKSSFKKASSWMLNNDRLRVQLDADTMKMRTEMQEDASMAVEFAKYMLAMEKFCGNVNHVTAADFDPATKDRQFRGRLIHRLLAHTHEVMRNEHDAGDDTLFQQQSDSGFAIGDSTGQRSLLSSNLFDLPPLIESSPSAPSGRSNPQRKDSIAVRRLKQLQRPDSATKQPSSYLRKGADMADQREVITLFINLQFRKDLSIAPVDMASCSRSPFHFLQEHDPEKLAQDQQVLVQYQQCLKHIVLALHSSGGQLRQFIVDDKGTVAIGTFGLRGSVSRDIASSAIDVAQKIIDELQFVHLASASVGVTAGKVYNGLVGSPFRHEFAVMGPSVNMSARLMGKAPPNTVLCDDIVHSRDQVHQFVHFADVSAKGYDRPVPTFTPLSDSQLTSNQPNSNMMSHIAQHVEKHVVGNNDPLDADSTVPLTERMATPPSDDDIFIGRVSEIDQIEAYLSGSQPQEIWGKVLRPQASELFLMLPSESSTTENASSSALSAADADLLSSYLSTPTRVIVLDGVHGIGKSHILQEISNRIAHHLERVDFLSPVAIHSLPQRRLKEVEPFISFRPLLDTMMYRYADWVANRPFDPLSVVGFSRRTKTKILRGLSMLIGSLPLDVQVFAPLLRVFNKQYASDDNDVTKKLSPVDRTRHLSFFLFQLVQAFQRAINRVLVLNM
jgi:class 3 adenylate cyclase